MKIRLLGAASALLVLSAAPLAFAQTKSDSSASTPPAADDANATGNAGGSDNALPAIPPEARHNPSSVYEDPNLTYYFVGARYRGTVIPQFLVNLFVNQGGTFYSNTVGLELEMRKDNHSTIPWIGFTEYGFGDTLFEQKGKDPGDPGNWSVVNSSLKAVYLGLDEMWSTNLDEGHHLAFEYGFGVGIGAVFGDLQNDWVHTQANGPLHSSANGNFAMCQTINDGNGCMPTNHQNATINKVGHYVEPNWFNGGSVPVIFPHVSFPQFALRYKAAKEFEGRIGLGFSLTGFWFGVSMDYGLEKKSSEVASGAHSGHDML
jgi:hypothetical protein